MDNKCYNLHQPKDILEKQKIFISTVNIARIFTLWRLLKCPKFDSKSLSKLDSTEVIIQLNALCLGLDLKISEIDPEILWRYLHDSSLNFPLGLQIKYLSQIGFSQEEIKSLLLVPKPVRLSSKSLPMTHKEYVPLMTNQLSKIKQTHPDLTAIELMNFLRNHDYALQSKDEYEEAQIQ